MKMLAFFIALVGCAKARSKFSPMRDITPGKEILFMRHT